MARKKLYVVKVSFRMLVMADNRGNAYALAQRHVDEAEDGRPLQFDAWIADGFTAEEDGITAEEVMKRPLGQDAGDERTCGEIVLAGAK